MKLSKEPFSLSNLFGYNVIEKNVKHWYQYQLDNNSIAFAAIGTNPYHPYCDEVSINVHPDYQRQGIATQLLEQIEFDSNTDEAFVPYLSSNAPTNQKRNFYSQVMSDLAHTYSTHTFEIDNTDPEAMFLIELLQLEEIPSYDAYLK